MIDIRSYRKMLSQEGRHIGEVRKNQADMIMNTAFTGDISYRKVYILSKEEGWHFEDARFSRHSASSIAKDQVDSYLQFRPKVHYPIGTYVFIPDDTKYDLTISPIEVEQKEVDNVCPPVEEEEAYDINGADPLWDGAKNLWLIVGRNDDKQFVRYLVLKCDWKFRWVTGYGDRKELQSCWGCHKSANSYTSGWWTDFRTTGLDSLTSFWLPDTYLLFGDDLTKYQIDDTRTVTHQVRTMITNNDLHPSCYIVSKILDVEPQGVIKLSMKLDQFNPKRDNVELRVCDYFNDTGDIIVDEPVGSNDPCKTSEITHMLVNADNELEPSTMITSLIIGATYYWSATFSDTGVEAQWRIKLIDEDDMYSEKERLELERLMVIRDVNDTTISLRPGKSNRLKGLQFKLVVCDVNGDYESSVNLEVEND